MNYIEIKYNSPLEYLDYDISLYLYETYYPSKSSKYFKKILHSQFKTIVFNYKKNTNKIISPYRHKYYKNTLLNYILYNQIK